MLISVVNRAGPTDARNARECTRMHANARNHPTMDALHKYAISDVVSELGTEPGSIRVLCRASAKVDWRN